MAKKIFIDGEYEDWSRGDWEDYIDELAEKVAAARIKQNRRYGFSISPDAQEKYQKEYKRRMLRDYPYDKLDDKVYFAFENAGEDRLLKWVDGWKDMDPMAVAKQDEFKKFAPLLSGIAKEGENWYQMGGKRLQDIGGELGFKTGTPEGYKEFLDKLAEYQKTYDRALLVKEMQDMPGSGLTAIAYPTLYKAIENSVAEGTDLSKGKAVALGLLDAGINGAQFMAPSANILRGPVANGVADAVLQGALEANRQGWGNVIGDVEPDYVAAPITSITAGATRPALVGSAQGLLSGFTGPDMMKFRRGMMGSMRTGNPVYMERTALEKSIDEFNERMARNLEREAVRGESGKALELFLDEAEKNAAIRANLPAELGRLLGISRKAGGPKVMDKPLTMFEDPAKEVARRQENLFLDKDAILAAYDKLNPKVSVTFKDGIATVNKKVPGEKPGDMLIGGDTEGKLRSLVPNKFSELEDMDGWYRAGMGTGTFLGDIGGRLEPTFKVNPLNPFMDSPLERKDDDYKKTQWYGKLSKKSREIIDEAFRKKAEEEEEE